MGILNLTPDSFFDGGLNSCACDIRKHVEDMVASGVDIIDVGGCSTRPGSLPISPDEEWSRVKSTLDFLSKQFPDVPVSIDTFSSLVAERAVDMGASIINDISGGEADSNMFDTVARLGVPYVLSHIKGTPKNMQQQPVYEDVVAEVLKYFRDKIQILRDLGIADIIIDPGFGFGKTLEHNFTLLKHLHDFTVLNLPILVGFSRKSMIQKVLGVSADDSLNGTTVVNTIAAASGGANILRVHDVKQARECLQILSFLKQMK